MKEVLDNEIVVFLFFFSNVKIKVKSIQNQR